MVLTPPHCSGSRKLCSDDRRARSSARAAPRASCRRDSRPRQHEFDQPVARREQCEPDAAVGGAAQPRRIAGKHGRAPARRPVAAVCADEPVAPAFGRRSPHRRSGCKPIGKGQPVARQAASPLPRGRCARREPSAFFSMRSTAQSDGAVPARALATKSAPSPARRQARSGRRDLPAMAICAAGHRTACRRRARSPDRPWRRRAPSIGCHGCVRCCGTAARVIETGEAALPLTRRGCGCHRGRDCRVATAADTASHSSSAVFGRNAPSIGGMVTALPRNTSRSGRGSWLACPNRSAVPSSSGSAPGMR